MFVIVHKSGGGSLSSSHRRRGARRVPRRRRPAAPVARALAALRRRAQPAAAARRSGGREPVALPREVGLFDLEPPRVLREAVGLAVRGEEAALGALCRLRVAGQVVWLYGS